MNTDRRTFIKAASLTALACAGPGALASLAQFEPTKAKKKLKILMLGGTGFLGPSIVNAALTRGHEVTLFNRGRTDDDLFPDLELIKGDRDPRQDNGYAGLLERDREWDAVIDTANVHKWVEQATALLKDRVEHYTYISTMSVYASNAEVGVDESAERLRFTEDQQGIADSVNIPPDIRQWFGHVKAHGEYALEEAMPDRGLIIRPGLIVGPRDFSGRFTYWPVRARRGGDIVIPGPGDDPIQYIDVRDLGEWTIHAVENKLNGPYNAIGPGEPMTIKKLAQGCIDITKSDGKLVPIPTDTLLNSYSVQPWMQMPVWVPPQGEYAGFGRRSFDKALSAGLKHRPLKVTVEDTLEWYDTLTSEQQMRFMQGLRPEREQVILSQWRDSQSDD